MLKQLLLLRENLLPFTRKQFHQYRKNVWWYEEIRANFKHDCCLIFFHFRYFSPHFSHKSANFSQEHLLFLTNHSNKHLQNGKIGIQPETFSACKYSPIYI